MTQSFTDVVAINILWSVCIVHTQVEELLPAFKKQGGGATGSTLITTFIQSNMCETAGEGGVGGGASYANSMQTNSTILHTDVCKIVEFFFSH